MMRCGSIPVAHPAERDDHADRRAERAASATTSNVFSAATTIASDTTTAA
jgi:hypothetical protein